MDIEAETAALRRVAHALVHDAATADDMVQETWVAAVRTPPSDDRPLRPWLPRVLRNRSVSQLRSARRAQAREAAAAPPAPAATPEQLQLCRQLLDEIAALPSLPKVVLRFPDGVAVELRDAQAVRVESLRQLVASMREEQL